MQSKKNVPFKIQLIKQTFLELISIGAKSWEIGKWGGTIKSVAAVSCFSFSVEKQNN